jgi:predicted dienelactone hydrolase
MKFSPPSPPRALRRGLVVIAVVAGFTLLAGCSSNGNTASDTTGAADTAPASTAPASTGPATTVPATTLPAKADFEVVTPEYQVGVTTITITDPKRNRPLTTEVWFPIDDATGLPPHQYTFIPGSYYQSPTAVTADASAMSTDAPFPLVVFSHGAPGLRILYPSILESIAAAGYIVVAPDHTGNTTFDLFANTLDPIEKVAINRPLDVSAVIDAMTNPQNPETAAFASAVDPQQIAVAGQSAGGYTAYAAATGVTNSYGTAPADPRIDAIIAMAPATGDDTNGRPPNSALAGVTIPALLIGGTGDSVTPISPNIDRLWNNSKSSPFYRVELKDGEHQSYTDFCEFAKFVPTLPNVPKIVLDAITEQGVDSCAPTAMPSARAHELTSTFSVAFLDSVFRNAEMINPATTHLPVDVTVQAM